MGRSASVGARDKYTGISPARLDADHNNKKRKQDTVERSIFLDQSGSTPEVGTLTVGSLFSGIGGFELGFEATGRFETRWQVECDPYATKVLEKHWPDVVRHDDVCTWPKATTELVDVLLGGFPCQDISYAGKGAGLNGKRSGLFYEVMRIVREMGPKYVVLENVSALLTRGMGDVLGSLSSLGFNAEWEIVSAASVGAPHRRDRVFIIGYLGNPNSGLRNGAKQKILAGWSIPKLPSAAQSNSKLADSNDQQCEGCEQETLRGKSRLSRKSGRSCENQRTQWATEPSVGRVADGVPKRMDRLRCLGNAIVPQVAKVVAERLLQMHDAEGGG